MQPLRAIKLAVIWFWAATVLLFGVTLCRYAADRAPRLGDLSAAEALTLGPLLGCLGVAAAAAGLLAFMCFVADDLCPKAPLLIIATLKAAVALIAVAALTWAACLSWLLL